MFAPCLPLYFTSLSWRHLGRDSLIHGNRAIGNSLDSLKIARLLLTRLSIVCVCAGSILTMGVAQAGTLLVTNNLINEGSQAQTNVPVIFGQIFKDGDVPAGEALSATFGGQPIQLQIDVKATNPDGSLRHAVLTALVPTISGNSTVPLALSTTSPSSPGSPVTLTQLLATSFDATVDINIGGTDYTASAKQLLQANQAACAPWNTACNVWLSGPLVSEWIVGGPVTSAGGVSNPNLQVYFNVRAYAGTTAGSIAYVRVNIVVENSWAYTPQAQPAYTATLTSGSASYTSPPLTQYAYTRWHHVLWWNSSDPDLYLQQDTQYIQSTGAVSRYEILQPDETFLSSRRQFCPPLNNCDQTKNMSNVGAQDAIGPLPRWTSTYIVDPDIRAYNYMLADDDAAGTYSFHFRDQATGQPLSIVNHPYVTTAAWESAYTAAKGNPNTWGKDLLPNCASCGTAFFGTGNPYSFDNEHDPSIGYVPYMVTGSFYYLEELEFTASYLELWANPAYRNFSQGLMWAAESAPRAKAWDIRNLGDAAYLVPNNAPMKAEFTTDLANVVVEATAATINNSAPNPLHVVANWNYPINGVPASGVATWQAAFLIWEMGHLAEQGVSGASSLRDWMALFQIDTMTDWMNNNTQGFCWLLASAYAIQMRDANQNLFTNFSQVYQATFPTLYGLACNTQAMVNAMATLQNQTWQAGQMSGYANSVTGYPSNLQIGLAMAADTSLPNAQQAWQIFQSRSVQPSGSTSYNDYPNFAVLPRYLPAVPIVNIYASPNPVAAAGDTTTLYWTASNATSCSAPWTNSTATSGQATVTITATSTFPITCTGPNGSTNDPMSVGIGIPASSPPPPPTTPPRTTPTPTASTGAKGGAMDWLGLVLLMGLMGWSRIKRRPASSRSH